MGKVSFDGVTGKVAFDEYGDTTTKVLTVYKVEDGKWAPAKTGVRQSWSAGSHARERHPPSRCRCAGTSGVRRHRGCPAISSCPARR